MQLDLKDVESSGRYTDDIVKYEISCYRPMIGKTLHITPVTLYSMHIADVAIKGQAAMTGVEREWQLIINVDTPLFLTFFICYNRP